MSNAIDMVVFDMDGVLAQLDRAHRLALLAEATGKDPAFLQAAIWDSDFEASAELGAFPTGAEYLAEFNRRTHSDLTREQWVRARREAMRVQPETLALANQLRECCNIAMLTNNGSLLYESIPEIMPDVYRVFGDRAHASFQFGARKPQVEVFTRLLARYGATAARSVFVDDYEGFVAGARAAGLHGICYAGAAELRRSLREFGLPIE
jgi:glucose-1-phosphatase